MRLGKTGVDFKRLATTTQRLIGLPEFAQHIAQIEMRRGEIRPDRQRRAIARHRFFELTETLERVAQIEPAAEQMETLQTFMKERNLTSQNVSELLVVGGLLFFLLGGKKDEEKLPEEPVATEQLASRTTIPKQYETCSNI